MEVECSKCQQKFEGDVVDMPVCPDCLRKEFTITATRLDEQERAELVAEYAASMKRQSARAAAMGVVYASGSAFDAGRLLRLALGIGLFLVCALIFFISDKDTGINFLTDGDISTQRIFSMVFCGAAAVLIATAPVYFKKIAYIAAFCVLLLGWVMPDLLAAALKAAEEERKNTLALNATEEKKQLDSEGGPVLTDADLQVFYALRSVSHRLSHYAVFIDKQDSRTREIVREALGRLLQAEYTRAYTRANGALFVCNNVPGTRRNISDVLVRFGTVTHAVPDKGVYEVRFDPDRANMVSQYSPEVLTSPMHASYVAANLSELRCLDPLRVRMSARSLANSDVQVLRGEIRQTLLEVLQDPWASAPDTYSALIDALVVYSFKKDKEATQVCYNYFEARHSLKREVNRNVIRYLIMQNPAAMVSPIIDLWTENPVEWADMLSLLGFRAQAPLLARLKKTENIRLIGSILKYMENHGTAEALPAIEPFLEYPDSIIRHSARAAVTALQTRK